jgi:hypothetical protein
MGWFIRTTRKVGSGTVRKTTTWNPFKGSAHSYSACVIPEAASFRRTACAHSSSILKYRATAFVPTSKGCASPNGRGFRLDPAALGAVYRGRVLD